MFELETRICLVWHASKTGVTSSVMLRSLAPWFCWRSILEVAAAPLSEPDATRVCQYLIQRGLCGDGAR
jgi:hypothetical protein